MRGQCSSFSCSPCHLSDCSRVTLELYRKRTGATVSVSLDLRSSLSIQPFEGSRFVRGGRYGISIDFGLEVIEKQSVRGTRKRLINLKGLSHSLRRCVAPQRRDCASLVPLNIKHSGQSSHLKQVIYSLVQVYEPKLTTLIPNSRVGLDQFAYS